MQSKMCNQRRAGPTGLPGHHRPLLTKQLRCQSLQCGMRRLAMAEPASQLPCKFWVRQSRAVGSSQTLPGDGNKPEKPPDLAAVGRSPANPIKAAAGRGDLSVERKAASQPWPWLKR